MFREIFKIAGVVLDELGIDPLIMDQNVCQAVVENKILFGLYGKVLGGGIGGFGFSRVDHYDFR